MEGETLIAMARRHVRQGQTHIDKQHAIISRLTLNALPTDEARHLLTVFQDSQNDHQRHLDQIVDQQRTGERNADGNLVAATGAPLI